MLDISTQSTGKRLPGIKRKTPSLRIDMTPMVDLGFLLISFFVITTQLSQSKSMDLIVPHDGKASEFGRSKALSLIICEEKIHVYAGDWEIAKTEDRILSFADTREVRRIIQERQAFLDNLINDKEGRDGLMLLIKPTSETNYHTLVDLLDEVIINDVKKYAVVKPDESEMKWLKEN